MGSTSQWDGDWSLRSEISLGKWGGDSDTIA